MANVMTSNHITTENLKINITYLNEFNSVEKIMKIVTNDGKQKHAGCNNTKILIWMT